MTENQIPTRVTPPVEAQVKSEPVDVAPRNIASEPIPSQIQQKQNVAPQISKTEKTETPAAQTSILADTKTPTGPTTPAGIRSIVEPSATAETLSQAIEQINQAHLE